MAKSIKKETLKLLVPKTTIDVHRVHRWYLGPCSEFLMLREMKIEKNRLILGWYLTETHTEFILNGKIPTELELHMIDGKGRTLHKLFTGVKKVKNDFSSLIFDYADSDIQEIVTILKFKRIKVVKCEEPETHEAATSDSYLQECRKRQIDTEKRDAAIDVMKKFVEYIKKYNFVDPVTGRVRKHHYSA